jgi:hypothetical protein
MKAQSLSSTEIAEIEGQLQEAINNLITGCESLDIEMAFQIFSNSPDFLMMATDGTVCDYQTYLNDNVNYLSSCSSFNLTTFQREIRVLDRNTAVLAWAYGAEATLKTGERDIIERAGASFLFKKVEDEWKVVYDHESSVPPRRETQGH